MKVSVFSSRAWIPVSVLLLENPVCRKTAFLGLLSSLLAASPLSADADDVVYKVRLENGVDQYYRLEVPAGITPVKLNPSEWNQPQYATDKIPQAAAILAAVGWAGGLEDHDMPSGVSNYPNSLTNVGGKIPGGFYHASYIKVGDVQYLPGPFPSYLVHLNGQIGQTRQSFYADVLEDGRIVRPVEISASEARGSRELERPNPVEQWGGSEKMRWGGAEAKKDWGGAEKKKWGGSEEKPSN